jgi:hypothetical protein
MATGIVEGLFGVTPEMYQQAQQQRDLEAARGFAQLTPYQQVSEMAFAGGRGLGQAVGGLLGVEDPQLALIRTRQQVGRSIDFSNPESIQKAVSQLSSMGDSQGAALLAQEYRKAMESGALVAQRTAEKMTPEQRNALAIVSSKGLDPRTPEGLKAYQDELMRLTTKEQKPETFGDTAEIAARSMFGKPFRDLTLEQAKEVRDSIKKESAKQLPGEIFISTARGLGLEVKDSFADYTPEEVAKVNDKILQNSLAKAKANAITIDQRGFNAFEEAAGKFAAKKIEESTTKMESNISLINNLNRLNLLSEQGVISGSFALGRVGAANLLQTIGVLGQNDADRLARSQNYEQTSKQVALDILGGRLGAGFSNDDRKFIADLVPRLENDPKARKQLTEYFAKRAQESIDEGNRLIDYAYENKSLKGYKPKVTVFGESSTISPRDAALQNLSTDELLKLQKQLNKKP